VPYFYFDGIIQLDHPFKIKGEEASHILQSRRIKDGEIIQVQDQGYHRYQVQVEQIHRSSVSLIPISIQQTPPPSPLGIHLFQALVKEKSLDFIIQKTTELGVRSIQIFHSRFSQRINSSREIEKKIIRWSKIAFEACKQSGRRKPPGISFANSLSEFHQFSQISSMETIPTICLMSSEEENALNHLRTDKKEINLIVGPEGGLAKNELQNTDCANVHFGPRTLRADTAAVSAVSVLQFLHGDMGDP